MSNLKDSNSNWLFIVPISGLWLTKVVNHELKVENVIFVSKEKLPRIRKRLGLPIVISQFDKIGINTPASTQNLINHFFTCSKTYAVTYFSGTPKDNETDNIRRIEKAISLIAFSNLGYSTRKFDSKIEIKSSDKVLHHYYMVIDKDIKRFSLGLNTLHPMPLELNERWKKFQNYFYYDTLLNIINGNKKVNNKWKNLLVSVAAIVGKSINSHDIPESFLKNVIALEMLLVNQGEKIEEKIIERSSYLLDWSSDWKELDLENSIKKMYKKRCDYVHDGKTINIQKEDLIFTDDLIFNIYNNILRNIDKITSKGQLVEFSQKYQCEKMLGIKSKFQFGKFQYFRKHYEKNDINEL